MPQEIDDSKSRKRSRNVGPLSEHKTQIRVSYRDTDQMGLVYYANYLVYFEIARTDLLRHLGGSYRQWEEEKGVFLPVRNAQCRYLLPARYDDLLEITTRVTRWTQAALDFRYECRRAKDRALLAEGTTFHAFTNKDGRVIRAGRRVLEK